MKISPRFYNPKFWRLVKCALLLALFIYELTVSLSRIPEGKSYLMPIIWCLAIIGELILIVDAKRMKPVVITEEYVVKKNAQILANIKRWFFGGLAMVVIITLSALLAGKPMMSWGEFFTFALTVIICFFLLPIFISLGSDLPPKDDEESEEK